MDFNTFIAANSTPTLRLEYLLWGLLNSIIIPIVVTLITIRLTKSKKLLLSVRPYIKTHPNYFRLMAVNESAVPIKIRSYGCVNTDGSDWNHPAQPQVLKQAEEQEFTIQVGEMTKVDYFYVVDVSGTTYKIKAPNKSKLV